MAECNPDLLELHVTEKEMNTLQDLNATMGKEDKTDEQGADATEIVEILSEGKNEQTDEQIDVVEDTFDALKDIHSDTTDEVDAEEVESNSEFVPLHQESRLHCALCGNFCKDPKLLPACFHTFCLECLEKLKRPNHKFISCPVCRSKSDIPERGLSHFMSNEIVSSFILAKETLLARIPGNCVVCKLHDEVKEIAGQCQDCDDLLCEDCCEKHTFSRLTASHTVTKLCDMHTDTIDTLKRRNTSLFCEKHTKEELKFFCQDCSVVVCRDCILLEHGQHTSVLSESIYQKVKENIESEFNELKSDRDKLMQMSLKDSLEMINTAEEKQLGRLEEAKQEVINLIEGKFQVYRDTLQEEFQKCRHYNELRQTYLDKQNERIKTAAAEVEFYMQCGQLKMIVAMQKLMKDNVTRLKTQLKKTFSPLEESKLPTVNIAKDPIQNLSHLKLVGFTISLRVPKDAKQKEESSVKVYNKVKPSGAAGTNAGSKQHLQKSQGKTCNHGNTGTWNKTVGFGKSPGPKRILGRGSVHHPVSVPMRASGRGTMLMQSYSSLLGAYPGYQGNGNLHGPHGDAQMPVCPPPFDYYSCYGNSAGQNPLPSGHSIMSSGDHTRSRKVGAMNMNPHHAFRQPNSGPAHQLRNRNVKMQLMGTFNCRTQQDLAYVDIVGLAFTNQQVIAVSDANNGNLKLFNKSGEWLDMILDRQPRTVTYCDNHLVWNSLDETAIKAYDLLNQKLLAKRQLNVRTHHPVTSYRDTKYIMANLKNHQIQACSLNGEVIHTLVGKDGQGRPLKSVCQIAACFDDQLVMIDKTLNRVIVNNFDGDFKGEYQEPKWLPGCLAIDHLGNIFVTDSASNRLIMLSSVGEYLTEWTTSLEKPFALSCNLNGVLAIAGRGNTVCLYQYQY